MLIMDKEAIIIGAFMYIILHNLDKEDIIKGSIARLRQRIFATLKKAPREYARSADEIWDQIVEQNKDKFVMYISPVVETLFFNNEKIMIEAFGKDFGDLVSRATMKIAYGNDETALKNSYLVADLITEGIKKCLKN